MREITQIGRYEIERQLGRGGMAVVYLARDPLMERQVAIKLLARGLTFDAEMRARFRHEARVIASLEHPAIVPVHDFGEFDEQPYLVMRYMPGGSLRQRMPSQRPVPLPEVVRILTPIAAALDKAHSQHVIHRDLKPGNILFDADNNPYLADFGIARLAQGNQTMSIMGTPAYMSPEQVRGDVPLDGRSDIYALGVILFEMLSGQQPFHAETPTQQMLMHLTQPVPDIAAIAPSLPAGTQAIIEKALAKDRNDRYPTAVALITAVAGLASRPKTKPSFKVEEMTVVEPFFPVAPSELEQLYGRFEQAVSQSDWVDVLALGAQIEKLDTHYRDVPQQLARARRQLTQKAAPAVIPQAAAPAKTQPVAPPAVAPTPAARAPQSRARPWWLLGVAAVILLGLCGTLTFFGVRLLLGGGGDEPEATAVPAVAVATATAEPTAAPTATPEPEPSPTWTAVPEATPTSEPTVTTAAVVLDPNMLQPGELMYSDDFSLVSSGDAWDLWSDDLTAFSLDDGAFIAESQDVESISWSRLLTAVDTVDLTIDGEILQGDSQAYLGLMFLTGTADENYVGCVVQGDNSGYCFDKLDGNVTTTDWMQANFVPGSNRLRLVVSAGRYAMLLNGQCVGSGSADSVPEGYVALVVSTNDANVRARVAYDNLEMRVPDKASQTFLRCQPVPYSSE